MRRKIKHIITRLTCLCALIFLTGCIKMGMPEGEVPDETVETVSADQSNSKKAETAVLGFVSRLKAGDYNGLSESIYLPEGAFIFQEDLEWFLPRSQVGEIISSEEEISGITVSGTAIEKTVSFTFGSGQYALDLRLGNDNLWKIILDGLYVENWSLRIPAGCTLTVDEKNVDGYRRDLSSDQEYSVYTFPAIAAKTHRIAVTSSLYGRFTQEITPKSSSDTVPVICGIGEAETGNILRCIQIIWNGIYEAYTEGADVPDIRKYFVKDYDTNALTMLLKCNLPSLCTDAKNRGVTYRNFYLSAIEPWKKDNYGAATLAADNAVYVTFGYRLEFTDSEGNYHNCNKVTSLTVAYEGGTYRIRSLNDSTLFTYNNYQANDF